MKYLSLLVLFSFLFLQTGFSQVKKQYVDAKHSATTVVVKEDNVSDLDILNSQFDLNSIGMGQVIKIKTEHLQPKGKVTPKAEVPKAEVPQAEVTVPTPTKKIVKKAAVPPKVKERTKPTTKYYSGIGKSKKVKMKRKKIKKRRKFKKRKKRRVSCYSF